MLLSMGSKRILMIPLEFEINVGFCLLLSQAFYIGMMKHSPLNPSKTTAEEVRCFYHVQNVSHVGLFCQMYYRLVGVLKQLVQGSHHVMAPLAFSAEEG